MQLIHILGTRGVASALKGQYADSHKDLQMLEQIDLELELRGREARVWRADFEATGELERVGSSKTHTVDVRILSATNAVVSEAVSAGRDISELHIAFLIKSSPRQCPDLKGL